MLSHLVYLLKKDLSSHTVCLRPRLYKVVDKKYLLLFNGTT
ncbi:hypothetical protein [Polaromonas sp. C04]|nr:hypothetical protein [Polaromonas sp. C04]